MCDTFVARGSATSDGSVIFGKNSDREPNEAHELLVVPQQEHDRGATVRCTHIAIDQVRRTRRVLLARPYWIWGAEMGLNDAGVVIGNEALFNKGTGEDLPGLIGMDLLRLALERAATSAEAVTVISALLAEHGQAGQAGHVHDFTYDNSFLIADADESWILETMGRDWVARRVTDLGSISNGLTTRKTWDLASAGVTDGTDVARRWTEPVFTRFADAGQRQCATQEALAETPGEVTVRHAFDVLRSHRSQSPDWSPAYPVIGQDVCMHAGYGPVRSSQTTGSLVVRLGSDGATAWVTGTAAPCTSTFKPVWVDTGLPDLGPRPRGWFDARTLWWRHELLHRATLADYPRRLAAYRDDRDQLQQEFVAVVPTAEAPAADRAAATGTAFARTAAAELRWTERVSGPAHESRLGRWRTAAYRRAWDSNDRAARLPEEGVA